VTGRGALIFSPYLARLISALGPRATNGRWSSKVRFGPNSERSRSVLCDAVLEFASSEPIAIVLNLNMDEIDGIEEDGEHGTKVFNLAKERILRRHISASDAAEPDANKIVYGE
jgi:hypothetical protein